jgi:phytanoyl-CoA hydroxylase
MELLILNTQSFEFPHVDAQIQDCMTEEQAQFFRDNGFLVVRNVLAGEELARVQAAMQKELDKGAAGVEGDDDYMYGKGGKTGDKVLRRIEYVIDKSDQMKVLLGHPFILRSVERLQGVNFIPTWDSMVIKMPNEGIIVPWHRDASVPSGAIHAKPIFNVDFYLDPSDLKTCLWVIPGSNKWSEKEAYERCKRDEDFDTSDAVPVPLNAGDVIFHDITVLHGSPSGDGNDLRRTVYYEFREAEVEEEFGPHIPAYIPIKQQILLACIERRANEAYLQEEKPFVYSPAGRFAVSEVKEPAAYRIPHSEYWRE